MRAAGARAVKLVAGAADLQARDRGDPEAAGRLAVSVFPMGPASAPGRVLALFGASLPGQASCDRGGSALTGRSPRSLRNRPAPSGRSLFGIVERMSRIRSLLLHNALFRSRGVPYLYLPLPLSDRPLEAAELEFDPPFRGFSVTRPWKLPAGTAVPSEDVRATGAANTLVFSRGRWRAENTDVDGVFDPLADHDTGEGRSAVILGAGGAARAAVVAARKSVRSHDREPPRRAGGRARAGIDVDSLAWEDVARSEADLYFNATPIGSRAEDPRRFPRKRSRTGLSSSILSTSGTARRPPRFERRARPAARSWKGSGCSPLRRSARLALRRRGRDARRSRASSTACEALVKKRASLPSGAAAYVFGEATRRRSAEDRIVCRPAKGRIPRGDRPSADYLAVSFASLRGEERELYRFVGATATRSPCARTSRSRSRGTWRRA